MNLRRAADLAIAGLLLALAAPVLGLCALAVLIESGRPVFFGHRRLGLNGRPFRCWKLRTMLPGADEVLEQDQGLKRRYVQNGFKLASAEDPRVTRAGRWLRRRHLDELPQLFNVLSGSMSLVGPRPVVSEELAEWGPEGPELLRVKPGITGAWTSLGRRRPTYPERARLELDYVRNRGIVTDLAILLRSVPAVLRGTDGQMDRRADGQTVRRSVPRARPSARPPVCPSVRLPVCPPGRLGLGGRAVLRNATALFLAYVLPRGLTFLAAIAAARSLGTSDFGAYGTAGAFAVILSIVATLGMIPLLVREFAQHPGQAPSLMRGAHWVKTASNVVMLAGVVVLVRLLGYSGEVQGAALLLAVAYAIGAYGENLAAYFQATERMHVWTQASALYGLVTGVVGGVVVVATRDLLLFSAAPILGQAAALGWLVARLPGPVRRGAPAPLAEVRRLLRSLAPFAVSFVVLTVYAKVDVLLLAHFWPASEVGLYTAAYKFVDITRALATVGAAAVYPRLSRAGGAAGDDVRLAGARLLELALLVAVPVAALLLVLRTPVVAIAFGPAYAGSIPVLALLAAVLPALAANVVALYVLAAARAMRWVALLYGVTLAVNLGLNLWLIPTRGAEGAALAMLLSEWALAVGALATARLVLGINLRPRALWLKPERAALAQALRRGPELTPEIASLERVNE